LPTLIIQPFHSISLRYVSLHFTPFHCIQSHSTPLNLSQLCSLTPSLLIFNLFDSFLYTNLPIFLCFSFLSIFPQHKTSLFLHKIDNFFYIFHKCPKFLHTFLHNISVFAKRRIFGHITHHVLSKRKRRDSISIFTKPLI
jgi:hypothetical protein